MIAAVVLSASATKPQCTIEGLKDNIYTNGCSCNDHCGEKVRKHLTKLIY